MDKYQVKNQKKSMKGAQRYSKVPKKEALQICTLLRKDLTFLRV